MEKRMVVQGLWVPTRAHQTGILGHQAELELQLRLSFAKSNM